MNPAQSSLFTLISPFTLILLVIGVIIGTITCPGLEKDAWAAPEKNGWDIYMNQMARIADENLSPVFMAVTHTANTFGQNENLQTFSTQLENSKTELLNIQVLMSGMAPPVQLLEADHYIREGVQQLMQGMDILINGIRQEQSQKTLLALESMTLGANYVVKGYGLLSEQSTPRPDLAKTP